MVQAFRRENSTYETARFKLSALDPGARYTVTNLGTGGLRGVTVTDDQGVTPLYVSGDTNGDGRLQSTETWIYEATGVSTAGAYANTGTASAYAQYFAGHTRTTSASDTSGYMGREAGIAIDKVTNGADGSYITPSTPITWTYTVTNTGNGRLNNVTVSDSDLSIVPHYVSGDADGDGRLQQTETWIFEARSPATGIRNTARSHQARHWGVCEARARAAARAASPAAITHQARRRTSLMSARARAARTRGGTQSRVPSLNFVRRA